MMRRLLVVFVVLCLSLPPHVSMAVPGGLPVVLQPPEATPEAPPSAPETARYEEVNGQAVRYEYTITTGDVMVSGLLMMMVFSLWVLAGIFYLSGRGRDG